MSWWDRKKASMDRTWTPYFCFHDISTLKSTATHLLCNAFIVTRPALISCFCCGICFVLSPLVQLLSAIRNTRRRSSDWLLYLQVLLLVKIPFRDVIPGFFRTYHPVGSRFKQSVPTVSRGFAQDRLATENQKWLIEEAGMSVKEYCW